MLFPEDLYYTADHEWVRLEGNDAVVGITAFAAGELGDIVFVELREPGTELEAGEVFGTIEAVKTVSDLFMPVGGKITAVNPAAAANPELMNTDPYGEAGWLVRLELTGAAAAGSLLNADQYRKLTGHD